MCQTASVRHVIKGLEPPLLADVRLRWQLSDVCEAAIETLARASLHCAVQEKAAPRRAFQSDHEHHATGTTRVERWRSGGASTTDRGPPGEGVLQSSLSGRDHCAAMHDFTCERLRSQATLQQKEQQQPVQQPPPPLVAPYSRSYGRTHVARILAADDGGLSLVCPTPPPPCRTNPSLLGGTSQAQEAEPQIVA